MNIAIIGGGFTGLTSAYELVTHGHHVSIFEREPVLGGLANGFKEPGWEWSLEYAYHHLFTNDHAIIGLIKELGLEQKLIITRPITANYLPPSIIPASSVIPAKAGIQAHKWIPDQVGNDKKTTGNKPPIYPFDSPMNLFQFPGLSLTDKFRTAILAAFCKINPFWQPLENITAKNFAIAIGGYHAWQTIWEPLLVGKFGTYANTVAASWLWARIHKRTPSLCYIEGGFQTLVSRLAQDIKEKGGKIYTSTDVPNINVKKFKNNSQFVIRNSQFDKVLLTVPTPIATKLLPTFSLLTMNHEPSTSIPHLHAQTLILETKEPILKNVYWLNITDRSFPFLAAVAHTNFMDKKHYGGHHITYFGNYLPAGHTYLSMTKEQLHKKFMPYIKRINSQFDNSQLVNSFLFTGLYAQPVHELNYSSRAPKLETPIPNLYLANMDSIYPWDRGTNYAVELGKKAAAFMLL